MHPRKKRKSNQLEDELKISYQSEDTGKSMAMMDAYTHTHSSLHIHTLYPCTPYNNKKLTVAPKIKKSNVVMKMCFYTDVMHIYNWWWGLAVQQSWLGEKMFSLWQAGAMFFWNTIKQNLKIASTQIQNNIFLRYLTLRGSQTSISLWWG